MRRVLLALATMAAVLGIASQTGTVVQSAAPPTFSGRPAATRSAHLAGPSQADRRVGAGASVGSAIRGTDATVTASSRATVARTVLALWDSEWSDSPRATSIHALAEMPLNHLGFLVRYHDIQKGLPSSAELDDVRGVLTWFARDSMPNPRAYLAWITSLAQRGIPVVVIGPLGARSDAQGHATPIDEVNRATSLLGWSSESSWYATTYRARYQHVDSTVMGFERALPSVIPPFAPSRATSPDVHVVLSVTTPDRTSDLVLIGPRGSAIASGFAYFTDRSGEREFRQWYVNPFEFFGRAFHTGNLPKADTTTLSGRRLYYSHVDGDGWRNLTQISPERLRYVISARVVLDRILRWSSDLPVSVGAIGGDLDPEWAGTAESLAVARDIFALPHVEAAIHTYSHPLDWRAFDPSRRNRRRALNESADAESESVGGDAVGVDGIARARMYDTKPFSPALEVDAAAAYVNGMLPRGKRVQLVQWPGDTRPFEAVLARARALGLANINGGDTRFDREFPSAAWVAPLGLQIGRERQVFASNSNENTYTDLWHDRFFGFSFLVNTVKNTGSPRRLKPFNIYYHMYSGERLSSLNAVLANINYARTLSLAPVEASRFSRIVEGFYTTRFAPAGPRAWRVLDRGALQTIRFDDASELGVDFGRSHGVIGQHHEQGSLYVALDEAEATPLVVLKSIRASQDEPGEDVPYLVQARWRVFDVVPTAGGVTFGAEGFGAGECGWQFPHAATVLVRWQSAAGRQGEQTIVTSASGSAVFTLPQMTGERVDVSMQVVRGRHER